LDIPRNLSGGTGVAFRFAERSITMKDSSSNWIPGPQPSMPGGHTPESTDAEGLSVWPAEPPYHAIHIDSCLPFEHLAVRTRRTDYEVVVLPGSSGEVLVRGGRFFKEFQRASLAGSTFGGSAIRMKTIEVGCPLELHVGGTRIVTSTIEAVSRVPDDGNGPRVM
jgi:hypothetical protein